MNAVNRTTSKRVCPVAQKLLRYGATFGPAASDAMSLAEDLDDALYGLAKDLTPADLKAADQESLEVARDNLQYLFDQVQGLFVDFRGMRELTGVQVPEGWKVRRPKRLGVPGGATLPVSTLKDCLFPVLSVAVAFGNASTIAGGAGADAPARFLDTSHGFQRSPPPCHEIPGRTGSGGPAVSRDSP